MKPPLKIYFLSDYSTAEFVRMNKNGDMIYKYIVATENLGKEFDLNEKRITQLIEVKLLKIEQ